MNDIIITSPVSENFYFGKTTYISFKIENIDKNFNKIKIFLNDVLIYNENKFLDSFEITPKSGLNQIRAYCVNKFDKFILNTDVEVYFNSITDEIEKQNQISKLIKYQLPEFIREEYPKFIDFIESYYEFLEKSNNPYQIPYNLSEYKNPNINAKWILDKLKTEYMPDFNVNLSNDRETGSEINESNILKNIKQFYDSKGTLDSIKFLFRILYDTEIQIKYPRDKILRPSDGSFVSKSLIKCYLNNFQSIKLLESAKIYQYNADNVIVASCYVTNITVIKKLGGYIASLDVKDIVGSFDINRITYLKNVIDGAEVRDFKINVIPQTDYAINFSVYDLDGTGEIDSGDYATILLAFGPVSEKTKYMDFNNDGDIGTFEVQLVTNLFGSSASIDTPIPNQVIYRTRYQIPFQRRTHGYWAKKNSLLSTGNVLPDNLYYHDYSYEVNGKISEEKYLEIVKRLGHPAGFKIFGSYCANSSMKIDSAISSVVPEQIGFLLLGNYVAYTFETKQDLNYLQLHTSETPQRAYPSGFKVGYSGKQNNFYGEIYVENVNNISSLSYNELEEFPVEEDPGDAVPEIPLNTPSPTSSDPTYAEFAETSKRRYNFGQYYPTDLIPNNIGLRPIDRYWVVGTHPNKLIENTNINSNTSFGDLKLEDVIKLGKSLESTDNV